MPGPRVSRALGLKENLGINLDLAGGSDPCPYSWWMMVVCHFAPALPSNQPERIPATWLSTNSQPEYHEYSVCGLVMGSSATELLNRLFCDSPRTGNKRRRSG